jgi:PAS domain S-box-containing protein
MAERNKKAILREEARLAELAAEVSALRDENARLRAAADAELRAALDAERARHAREVRFADERLRAILNSATDYAIVTLGADSRVAFWNSGAERIFGWRAGDMAGALLDILFTAEDREAGVPAQKIATALAEGRAINDQWHQRADGSRFWASGWMMAMRNTAASDTMPSALLLILRDRTPERHTQDALRESEEKLRHTVELNPQIPYTADPEGRIIDFSSRWLALTGLTKEETLGDGWARALLPGDAPRVLASWRRSIETGEPCDVEGRLRTAEGCALWFRSRAYPRRSAAGTILAWHGSLEDIHDRKMLEERLRALVELGDRLRELREPCEITLAAAELIGRTLGASRVGYATMQTAETAGVKCDWTDGSVASMAGTWNLTEFWHDPRLPFGPKKTTSVSDVLLDRRTMAFPAAYAAIAVRAYIWAPVVIHGQVAAFLFVHSAAPRRWSAHELSFARGAAERAWGAMERAAAEDRQLLMTRELNHRVKNTLSVVQGLAQQTVRGSRDLDAFGQTFQGRLFALARAHDLLTRTHWTGTPLREVIAMILESSSDIRLDLGDCMAGRMLEPPQALSLAMALHELETNAVKHGALSVPGGSVLIRCRTEEKGAAQLIDWQERGGPAVAGPPTRKGFGLRLLQRGLMAQSGLTTVLNFAPDGLRCTLRLPQAAPGIASVEGNAAEQPPGYPPATPPALRD